MSNPEKAKVEIKVGEEGGKIHVGVVPPLEPKVLARLRRHTEHHDRWDEVKRLNNEGDTDHTSFLFSYAHFGKFRRHRAERAIELISGFLSQNGTIVTTEEVAVSPHND
ncbi:MAG TPA: hypothetical protein VFX86_02870 [Candidatus Saccharimonadales bacterium]|nr:hypothetical protein [Candidatus Saccharimonadales bacterium]